MEIEIFETYRFDPSEFDCDGKNKSTAENFRDWVKDCEFDYHERHSSLYALNFYSNSKTMRLLQNSCGAKKGLQYGMDLYHGNRFNPTKDPEINHKIDGFSSSITVYGIDSAFMKPNSQGIPDIDEDEGIWPLTLLIDDKMRNNEIRLSCPDDDDNEEVNAPLTPKIEYAL